MNALTKWVLQRCLGDLDCRILSSEIEEGYESLDATEGKRAAARWRRKQYALAASLAVLTMVRRGPDPRWRRGGSWQEAFLQREGLSALVQDLRFGLRSLRRRPLFTALAVGTLALGIGATTTLFSGVNGVLLRPLPYADSGRLLQLGLTRGTAPHLRGFSVPQLLDLLGRETGLEAVVAARSSSFDLQGEGEPERVSFSRVGPGFFRGLGAPPALGRGFSPQEHEVADAQVAVISHEIWQRRWGGDPHILGKTFQASEEFVEGVGGYTIVGVAPEGFQNPAPFGGAATPGVVQGAWIPLSTKLSSYGDGQWYWRVSAIGKMERGETLQSVRSKLASVGRALVSEFPDRYRRGEQVVALAARPLLEVTVGDRRRDLLVLLGATGLLLLIACANVGGLLLARASDRGREMGIRVAMGAGRRRLVRQLLTESLILGGLGGLAGVLLAKAGVLGFKVLGPSSFPRISEIEIDPLVLLFAVGLALLASFLFGLAPAVLVSRGTVGEAIQSGGRGSTTNIGVGRMRAGLVAGEIALALILLTGSGLLFRSFLELRSVDPGIDPEGLIMMQVNLPASYSTDEARVAFFQELSGSLSDLPWARGVTHVENPPMGGNVWFPWIWREGEAERESRQAAGHAVGEGYFATMGLEIRLGRAFLPQDGRQGDHVVIVNEVMAREIWPGEDPIGMRITFGPSSQDPPMTVIGVVEPVRQNTLADAEAWEMYLPYAQRPYTPRSYMMVRTQASLGAVAGALRTAVWSIDGNIPVPEITTMERRVAATLHLPRFRTLLFSVFALAALALAAAGVYGTTLYLVSRRTREVGIRMALGASSKEVVAMILKQGSTPVGLGITAGLVGSLALSRLLESFLFGVGRTDGITFLAVTGLLGGLALVANLIPAYRAARLNPMKVLGKD